MPPGHAPVGPSKGFAHQDSPAEHQRTRLLHEAAEGTAGLAAGSRGLSGCTGLSWAWRANPLLCPRDTSYIPPMCQPGLGQARQRPSRKRVPGEGFAAHPSPAEKPSVQSVGNGASPSSWGDVSGRSTAGASTHWEEQPPLLGMGKVKRTLRIQAGGVAVGTASVAPHEPAGPVRSGPFAPPCVRVAQGGQKAARSGS